MARRAAGVATTLFLGTLIATPEGRAQVSNFFTSVKEVVQTDGPTVIETGKTVGELTKDAAPDSMIAPGQVAIDPQAAPTTIAGLTP